MLVTQKVEPDWLPPLNPALPPPPLSLIRGRFSVGSNGKIGFHVKHIGIQLITKPNKDTGKRTPLLYNIVENPLHFNSKRIFDGR